MSVTTKADEKIREAKQLIKDAKKCLMEVLDEDTWGSGDFTEDYDKVLMKSVFKLSKIVNKL